MLHSLKSVKINTQKNNSHLNVQHVQIITKFTTMEFIINVY